MLSDFHGGVRGKSPPIYGMQLGFHGKMKGVDGSSGIFLIGIVGVFTEDTLTR
jgi:hypothetical protein